MTNNNQDIVEFEHRVVNTKILDKLFSPKDFVDEFVDEDIKVLVPSIIKTKLDINVYVYLIDQIRFTPYPSQAKVIASDEKIAKKLEVSSGSIKKSISRLKKYNIIKTELHKSESNTISRVSRIVYILVMHD